MVLVAVGFQMPPVLSHVVINRPPSGSFEWCRNADVWCILYVFGHCPEQNKEIEPDNVITNDYMLFY